MKIKRILSTALVLVLLFASVSVVLPATKAEAAYSPSTSVSEATMTLEQIKEYISKVYIKSNFSTAEEMLAYELEAGYLDYSTTADGLYSIYVNRYTGFLYYRNNYSGQILTSNPVNNEPVERSNVRDRCLDQQTALLQQRTHGCYVRSDKRFRDFGRLARQLYSR